MKRFLSPLLLPCSSPTPAPPISSLAAIKATLFEGARLITGDGSAPIEDSAFLIENDAITRVGKKGEIAFSLPVPACRSHRQDVMPASSTRTATSVHRREAQHHGCGELHAREPGGPPNRYAYYGIAATLSMGVDRGELPHELRAIPVPGGGALPHGGQRYCPSQCRTWSRVPQGRRVRRDDEAEARKAVQELAAKKVDIVKIWVDDRDGTVKKLPPAMYRAIIDEAHKNNLRVAAHIFDLADAKELLRAGIDGFAHGVRDKDVDDEFMALIKQHPNVFVIPNLPDRGVAEDGRVAQRDGSASTRSRARGSAGETTPAQVKQPPTSSRASAESGEAQRRRCDRSDSAPTRACRSAGRRTPSSRTWSRRV